jgi:hypothetical protein
VDTDSQPQFLVERFGPDDLRGAMLRRSYVRRHHRALAHHPVRAGFEALLTAGLWPTGRLISRLWAYATQHRYRAGELADWLADRRGVEGRPYLRLIRRTCPQVLFPLAVALWLVAAGTMAIGLIGAIGGWLGHWPVPGGAWRVWSMAYSAAIGGAGLSHVSAVMQVRLRVEQAMERLGVLGLNFDPVRTGRDLPAWVLWPLLLLPAVVLVGVATGSGRAVLAWGLGASVGMLAAEVQRGYISVADRRARVAVARAIGPLLYGRHDGRRASGRRGARASG